MIDKLFRLLGFISELFKAGWLCGYALLAWLVTLVFFAGTGQGRDLLQLVVEKGPLSWWNVLLFLSAFFLAWTAWYTSRLLLGSEFEVYPLDVGRLSTLQRWGPRVLGALIPASVALGFLWLGQGAGVWRFPALYLLLAGAFFVVVWQRRSMSFYRQSRERFLGERQQSLGWPEKRNLAIALVLSFALMFGFVISPVSLPQGIGAPAIVLLALAGIAQFGGMGLTYFCLRKKLRHASFFALAWAALISVFVDNHDIRLASAGHHEAVASPPAAGETDRGAPLILVAASGGGIRAAYWTALNLAEIYSLEGMERSAVVISGVSGGSLGAATFATVRRNLQQYRPGEVNTAGARSADILARDFLSPVLAGMLFPDLFQRFVPVMGALADRQRFLEQAWEDAWGETMGSEQGNAFARPFYEQCATAGCVMPAALPVNSPQLLLNSTVVASGRRAVTSTIGAAKFNDTLDLLDKRYATRDILLSAAVGASARFSYVSPAGRLSATLPGDPSGSDTETLHLVDGGYFENSGAATLVDLYEQFDQSGRVFDPSRVALVIIQNDPKAAGLLPDPGVGEIRGERDQASRRRDDATRASQRVLSEVTAPISALMNTRSARGWHALVQAARLVQDGGGLVVELPISAVLREKVEPPLGWSLSESTRVAMRGAVGKRGPLAESLQQLQACLDHWHGPGGGAACP